MTAYKVFNQNWTCRGFQYEVGKTYTMEEKPKLCSNGFHACKKAVDCLSYYPFDPANKVAEVELSGDIVGEDGDKQASNIITILRELSWHEVLNLVNTGKGCTGIRNSGDWNSGNRNSGDSNSGNSNSGNSNSGNRNSGDWNSGNRNSGYFNTDCPKIRIFNKDTDDINIVFPRWFYFDLNVFVSHDTASDEERIQYKNEIETCGGFLKAVDYKTAWRLSYEKASERERQEAKLLPNWNADIFEEITGIRID